MLILCTHNEHPQRLVFGGVILGGIFEDVENPVEFYLMGVAAFVMLVIIGYVFYKIGNKKLAR